MKEVCIRGPDKFRAPLLVLGFFLRAVAHVQSQTDEIGALPTILSDGQLQSLSQLGPVATPERLRLRARRQLPKPPLPLSPEELSYREIFRTLGVDTHRFVDCDLPGGRLRTGVISSIRDDGLMLKDGIIMSQWIRYTDLTAALRPVAGGGTRIGQGCKWAGLVVSCIAVAPLALVFYPLVAAGVIAD